LLFLLLKEGYNYPQSDHNEKQYSEQKQIETKIEEWNLEQGQPCNKFEYKIKKKYYVDLNVRFSLTYMFWNFLKYKKNISQKYLYVC
jgi:hypothetical protein